jgi:hypothetical protein
MYLIDLQIELLVTLGLLQLLVIVGLLGQLYTVSNTYKSLIHLSNFYLLLLLNKHLIYLQVYLACYLGDFFILLLNKCSIHLDNSFCLLNTYNLAQLSTVYTT